MSPSIPKKVSTDFLYTNCVDLENKDTFYSLENSSANLRRVVQSCENLRFKNSSDGRKRRNLLGTIKTRICHGSHTGIEFLMIWFILLSIPLLSQRALTQYFQNSASWKATLCEEHTPGSRDSQNLLMLLMDTKTGYDILKSGQF